jgi:hypothetical protein
MVQEVAGQKNLAIEHRRVIGGGRDGKTLKKNYILKQPATLDEISHYILIINCGGDVLVPQRIHEEQESLSKKGYEKIVGIRDVYPNTKQDIPTLRRRMKYGIKTSLVPVQFILSVMEIEAWFLSEHNHFPLVDPLITVDAIRDALGFDPEKDDMADRLAPATDMEKAYQIGGKIYKKGCPDGTIDKLDYAYLYLGLRERIPELGEFLQSVDSFLA